MAYVGVHIPAGYKVEIETTAGGGTYTDLGVTMSDGSLSVSYDQVKVTGSRAEGLMNFLKNMTAEASFTLAQIELSNIHKLMSGATAYAAVAASPVATTDGYLGGAWAVDTFIPFMNQTGSGAVPTSITVESPIGTALTLDTDYMVVQNENGKWGILFIDTVDVDPANTMEINYTYTPSSARTLSMGSASVDIAARALKISKQLDTGKWFTVTLYAAVNTSGLTFSFPRYDVDEPAVLEVTMTGQLDTTRTDLDQLLKIEDQYAVTDI